MLKIGNVGENILVLIILAGFGYLIYYGMQQKSKGESGPLLNKFKKIFGGKSI